MSDHEIKSFLEKNKIELSGKSITSGRHRVCAMIGRIIAGGDYIPFLAEIKR